MKRPETTQLLSDSPRGCKSHIGVTGWDQGASGLLWRCRKRPFFRPLQLCEAAGPVPAPRQPSDPSHEDPCEYSGIVWDDLSRPGSLTLIKSAKALLHGRSHVHSSRGEGRAIVGGPLCSNKTPVCCAVRKLSGVGGIDVAPPGVSYAPWPLPGPCSPELPLV